MSHPLRPASLDTLRYLRRALSADRASTTSLSSACRRQKPTPSAKASISTQRTLQDHASTSTSTSTKPTSPSPSPADESSPPPRPPPPTHYSFFPQTLPAGPPPAGPFTPDARALRAEFLQAQARAHPDRAVAAQRSAAHALSARINEAYRTLAAPLPRALYLLRLRGDAGLADGEDLLSGGDDGLLMQVLELRERIEDAQEDAEVARMRAENERRIEGCVRVLERAFADDDLEAAKREAVRLRYWVNVEDVLREWEKGKPVVMEHRD